MDDEDSDTISEAVVKNEDVLLSDSKGIELNSCKRIVIYIVLVLIFIIASFDGGIIAPQVKIMAIDFDDKDEVKVGFYNSISSIGRGVGGIILYIFNYNE